MTLGAFQLLASPNGHEPLKTGRHRSLLGAKHGSTGSKGEGLAPPLHHMHVPKERSHRALRISACTSAEVP